MIFPSVGDGVMSFQLSRQNTDLKTGLYRLAGELSSGEVADRASALGGDTSRFSGIEHSLRVLETYGQATRETALTLTSMQTTLGAFDERRAALSSDLLTVSESSPSHLVNELAQQAGGTFQDLVSSMNTRVADRTLFAGAAVDGSALVDSETMLSDLVAAVGTSTTISDIVTTVEAWFEDPNSGFATSGYVGDSGDPQTRILNETASVDLDARADDPAVRDVLKSAALAALADRLSGLSDSDRGELLFESGVQLQSAASGVAQLQSRIGFAEQSVERASVENTAQIAALTIQRNDSVGVDPFEAATALQSLQIQLETHYAITARLSRLSLVEYLR
jgi:flagellar hook-associated protein 3 FlgL